MDDLRELGKFNVQGTSFSDAEIGVGGDGILELVHEVAPADADVAEIAGFADVKHHSMVAPIVFHNGQSDELLLDQEFDPIEGPRVDVRPAEKPYFLVSVPSASDSAEASLARGRKARLSSVPVKDERESAPTLADLLEQARALAVDASASEGRSRLALYNAIERAYDVALAAKGSPDELVGLLQLANIAVNKKAPATGIAKLVFGSAYDKTRLSEYATVLAHAERMSLGSGLLAKLLTDAAGGLKGVVAEERRLRRIEAGTEKTERTGPSNALARRLRAMRVKPLTAVAREGDEFLLVLARRLPDGTAAMIGEIPRDVSLLERAARRLADRTS